jgi:hypothetical protein
MEAASSLPNSKKKKKKHKTIIVEIFMVHLIFLGR